jgi:hypothetical protein
MYSPFIQSQIQKNNNVTLLSSTFENTQNIKTQLVDITVDNRTSVKVNNPDDAEQYIFNLVSSGNTTIHYNITPNELPSVVQRAANQIAIRTRRGSGNIILINSKTFDVFKTFPGIVLLKTENNIGRWAHVGKINGYIAIYVNDIIPDNRIYCLYGGISTVDSVGVLSESDEQLWFTPQPNTDLTKPENYIMCIEFYVI